MLSPVFAGTAAAVTTLAHSSGKDTTLAVAGAAGAAALANGLQKAVPQSLTTQLPPVITAGLQYLVITDDGLPLDGLREGLLFDAAFSACPITSS